METPPFNPSKPPIGSAWITAATVAAVLGISRRAVSKRLHGSPAFEFKTSRGQIAKGWEWQDIPDDWRAALYRIAKELGFRDVTHLIADAAAIAPNDAGDEPEEPIVEPGGQMLASAILAPLDDAIREVQNPAAPTMDDRNHLWRIILASGGPAALVLDYVHSKVPGLSGSRDALERMWRRKRVNPEDGRKDAPRTIRRLCDACAKLVIGGAVDLDGDIAQAWRRLLLGKKLCVECAGKWHFDPRSNKSYVPLAVRLQVDPDVKKAIVYRHGPKRARLLSPYVLRARDVGPGDVFEADDVTWNHVFYIWNEDDAGRRYVGRGECLLFLDRGSHYPLGYRLIAGEVDASGNQKAARYTGVDIRLGVLHVHDRVGLPNLGFQFENGVWKSRLVAGRALKGWQFNPWRECEKGLNDAGIVLGGGVSHAAPGNPRTKIIERVIRSVQERMRPHPGFVGFNHRAYNPEVLNDFLRRVKDGNEHPAQMFYSFTQFRDALDHELMEYSREVQNGRWLPGVSPLEVWQNGIGRFPGIGSGKNTIALRTLGPNARHLLSTHWRKVPVTGQGIRFEVGARHLVFWGDSLVKYQHTAMPVRWNIEEPELLHCLPPNEPPFTLRTKELRANTAGLGQLKSIGDERQRWMQHSKVIYDNLPHPFRVQVQRDNEHGPEIRAEGEAIRMATETHREEREKDQREQKRLTALAGALGIETPRGEQVSPRTIAARQRRLQQLNAEKELN